MQPAANVSEIFQELSPHTARFDTPRHRHNCSPELLTERLSQLVPLFDFVGAQVKSVTSGETRLVAPFRTSALNQNGTHQASVFYILADYASGIAAMSVLPGLYVIGIHDPCPGFPVQMWLKSGSVEHLAMATGQLEAVVQIDTTDAERMREQLRRKGRCEITTTVRFFQQDTHVATARHVVGVYAQPPLAAGQPNKPQHEQNRASSALMIAGLRPDPVSRKLAGSQGAAIASRMCELVPELPTLIRARSQNVERCCRETDSTVRQVLVLAAGFDSKPMRYASHDQPWFGLDRRWITKDRQARCEQLGIVNPHFRPVVADLLRKDWCDQVLKSGFDPQQSSLIIIEGLSMYLTPAQLRCILQQARSLQCPGSILWLDHITEASTRLNNAGVRNFFSEMSRLGEPMINRFQDIRPLLTPGWQVRSSNTAAQTLQLSHPILSCYQFTSLQACSC